MLKQLWSNRIEQLSVLVFCCLIQQQAAFGVNMFEAPLSEEDQIKLDSLMMQGISHQDSLLVIFERNYGRIIQKPRYVGRNLTTGGPYVSKSFYFLLFLLLSIISTMFPYFWVALIRVQQCRHRFPFFNRCQCMLVHLRTPNIFFNGP